MKIFLLILGICFSQQIQLSSQTNITYTNKNNSFALNMAGDSIVVYSFSTLGDNFEQEDGGVVNQAFKAKFRKRNDSIFIRIDTLQVVFIPVSKYRIKVKGVFPLFFNNTDTLYGTKVYRNDTIKMVGSWSNGKRHGLWITWDDYNKPIFKKYEHGKLKK